MLRVGLLSALICWSLTSFAQDQMAIRLNEGGILKILKLALKYNTTENNARSVVVPGSIYKFALKKSQLQNNPIIPVVNELSDLNLNRDLNFYLKTSNIRVTGIVDPKSLRTSISNSKASGFDFSLSLNLPSIRVSAPQVGLCENKAGANCGRGLKAFMNNLLVTTKGRPVVLNIKLRLVTSKGVARVKVIGVHSNLESGSSPALDINFGSLDIPKISIVINDVATELDTSKLRGEILRRKSYLAQKLLAFVADFVASDLTEMLNVYLVNKKVVTSWDVYRKQEDLTFDEFLSREAPEPRGGRYSVPAMTAAKTKPVETILDQVANIIRQAQMTVSLSRISTPLNKDIELYGLMNFILNNRQISVQNTLGNSNRPLPKLNLSMSRSHDVNLAISEPLLNGALDLASSTGLFQEVLNKTAPVQGFSIRNVKVHFTQKNTLVAVVNAAIDLKNLSSKSFKESVKHWIAAFLERNNNNAVIYFPIEVEIVPEVSRLSPSRVSLSIDVKSPFQNGSLVNHYGYPTNIDKMYETVRKGVMSDLRESLEKFTNRCYAVDLSKFLNQSGVEFIPKDISINQAAYLLMSIDIADIKFSSARPGGR